MAEDVPIINSHHNEEFTELPFKCRCGMDNTFKIQSLANVNKAGFSMIVITHTEPHECPFCKTLYMPIIPLAVPPLQFVIVERPGGIVTPHSGNPFLKN